MTQFNYTNRRASPAHGADQNSKPEQSAADAAVNGWYAWH